MQLVITFIRFYKLPGHGHKIPSLALNPPMHSLNKFILPLTKTIPWQKVRIKILEIKSTLRFNRYSQLILTGTLAKQIETIYN